MRLLESRVWIGFFLGRCSKQDVCFDRLVVSVFVFEKFGFFVFIRSLEVWPIFDVFACLIVN